MKKIALATVLVMIGAAAYAGAPVDPIIEPEIIVEEASTSAGGLLVPLLLVLILAAALI